MPARYTQLDLDLYRSDLLAIVEAVRTAPDCDERTLRAILRRHTRDGQGFFSKSQLVAAYRALCQAGAVPFERETLQRLQMKPVRTLSGVAPVAVLTKPAGCPGRCIFCPNDAEMPKSYLAREPGAQRALRHGFDPFAQTRSRLVALDNVGHPTEKVELLILGGTWSAYAQDYAEWFVQRCLDALNGSESSSLAEAQRLNAHATHRCVGLTIETRPDWVTPTEVVRLRQLGVTRVQLGIQSLDDAILQRNRREHDVKTARRASRLLRGAGFKLQFHWMPNLVGATPQSDRADFLRLWQDADMRPDELKIYPCALIEGTELFDLWQAGQYHPYDEATLVGLLADCKAQVPFYCRLNRVVRDIPSDYVVQGVRQNNLREKAQAALAADGRSCRCIRCREIGDQPVPVDALRINAYGYRTGIGRELFIAAETANGLLAGFLRLHVPERVVYEDGPAELAGSAIIREIHVYGPALHIGAASAGEAQHTGLGTRLMAIAKTTTREAGLRRLAVIAAVGTHEYYARRGFVRGDLYMHCGL